MTHVYTTPNVPEPFTAYGYAPPEGGAPELLSGTLANEMHQARAEILQDIHAKLGALVGGLIKLISRG